MFLFNLPYKPLGKPLICINRTKLIPMFCPSVLEIWLWNQSVQFSPVPDSCLTLCDPMNRSTPGLPVHHHLPEFTQTQVHRVSDANQPSHPLSFPSPPAPNPSQHQSPFQWVSSSHDVAKVLEFQSHSQFSDNYQPHYEKAWYRSSHWCWTITDECIIWVDSGQECIL